MKPPTPLAVMFVNIESYIETVLLMIPPINTAPPSLLADILLKIKLRNENVSPI